MTNLNEDEVMDETASKDVDATGKTTMWKKDSNDIQVLGAHVLHSVSFSFCDIVNKASTFIICVVALLDGDSDRRPICGLMFVIYYVFTGTSLNLYR